MAKMNLRGYDPEVTEAVKGLKSKEANKETNNSELPVTGSFTCRIDVRTVSALRRASVDRKISRQFPASQVEIVQDALDKWLKENGYLD